MKTEDNDFFHTTRWSLVIRSISGSKEALNELFSLYWIPIYGYIRRRVASSQEAEDLTQGFFARLFERDYLSSADPERGRLRAFLLSDLKFFLSNERAKEVALKRKADLPVLSLDVMKQSGQLPTDPITTEELDKWFDRNWALEVFDRALNQVRQGYEGRGTAELFELIQPFLEGVDPGSYAPIAEQLGRTTNYVKQQVFRLRERFRKELHRIVADTVEDEQEIEAEIRHLLGALR